MRPNQVPQLPATLPQIRAIYAIARGFRQLDEEGVDALAVERIGVVPQEMTRRQASEFIDSLKGGTDA